MTALAAVDIVLRRETVGEHRTRCPRCGETKARPRDDALAVRLGSDGSAVWVCFRCRWTGAVGTPGGDRRPGVSRRPATTPPAPAPDAERNAELAWRYLTERRGLTDWHRDRLLWHPACAWGSGTAGCIIAPVNDHHSCLVTAIWRVQPCLAGPVERRGLGPVKGNAARLYPAEGSVLALAEGVEDALSVRQLTGLPCWAALSAGNLVDVILPPAITSVAIFADHDPPKARGLTGIEAARRLAQRLRREGRSVTIRRPVIGKDPNDLLLAGRQSA